jgi:hypothetical protein
MEHLPLDPVQASAHDGVLNRGHSPFASVGAIPHDRVLDMSQMHPDLMGSPGPDDDLEERQLTKGSFQRPGAQGLAPTRHDTHFCSIFLMPVDGRINGTRWIPHPAVHQGTVFLVDQALLELSREVPVGRIGLGNQDDPAGVLVQAMYDTRAERPPESRQLPALMEKSVHQRSLPMSRSGMDHETGRLVHRHNVVVFKKDV